MKKAFLVKFNIKGGYEDAFVSHSLENLKATKQEKGNLRFELYRSGQYYLMIEVYEDDEAVQFHFTTPHFTIWKELTKDLIESSEFTELDFLG